LKKKVSSLEDYAVEVIQETEKDFNNAMGQESLTPLINLKKEKTNKKPKSAVEKDRLAKIKLSQTTKTSKYHPVASEKKPAITRK
jgi:hypothetical protein